MSWALNVARLVSLAPVLRGRSRPEVEPNKPMSLGRLINDIRMTGAYELEAIFDTSLSTKQPTITEDLRRVPHIGVVIDR